MQKRLTKERLALKLVEVIRYIDEHLDEALTLDVLSRIACVSKYHFHRIFLQYIGINLHQYLQLQRLKRASYRLVFHKEQRVMEVALDAGFNTAESFARAFKKHFGQTPTAFRELPKWQPWQEKYQYKKLPGQIVMQVKIVDFPETKIAVYEHRAAAYLLNDSIAEFITWRKLTGLSPVKQNATYGLAYNDPETVPVEDFKFDICAEVKQEVPDNESGIINKVIPEGRCAQIIHRGSHQKMNDSIYYLYCEWLPKSEESLRDFPCFFKYLNFFPEVAECDLVTEIYLPIV